VTSQFRRNHPPKHAERSWRCSRRSPHQEGLAKRGLYLARMFATELRPTKESMKEKLVILLATAVPRFCRRRESY
jgi:hypothetical protein